MTPHEKAKELFDKFYIDVLDREGTSAMNGFEAKQCALIAVDEIMKIVPSVYLTDDNEIHSGHYQYWQEVKQEIEKL